MRRSGVDRLRTAQQIVERVGERAGDERDRAANGIRVERVSHGERVIGERGVGLGKFLKLSATEQKRDFRQQIHFRSPHFRCVVCDGLHQRGAEYRKSKNPVSALWKVWKLWNLFYRRPIN